jgi:hypothetical protein
MKAERRGNLFYFKRTLDTPRSRASILLHGAVLRIEPPKLIAFGIPSFSALDDVEQKRWKQNRL